ncbi:hypothetical protein [Actinomadura sp. NPDC049753]|uniref:hypothetical protein n=1 Tax=Actinomadura sp. NPDC049753 TaxID=3154739 RepID=UPI0034188D8C
MASRWGPADTAMDDPAPIRALEARRIQASYGATSVWFGRFTRRWWALLPEARLVEASTPDQLGRAITATRGHRG